MSQTVNQARYQRNRKILAGVKRGDSYRTIATNVGCHHKTVYRVVWGLNH